MSGYSGLSVLFLGDLNHYSKGYSRLKAFRALGAKVEAFSHTPAGSPETGFAAPSVPFRIAWKLGFHLDTEGANGWLLRAAEGNRPDLVWIEKGNMLRPSVLRRLKTLRPDAIIASYSEDDMANRANRTWFYKGGLKHYDVVFTTKSYNADPPELPAMGARRVVVVDKAYDPDQHRPVEPSPAEKEWLSCDVGFIGSFERPRAEDMLHLARRGIPVRIWGNGWENFRPDEKNLTIERRALVNSADNPLYTKGICATRINLTFLRKANRDLQTDRSIEIPACGGFMLAEYSSEHARLFEEGREAAFFRSRDELVEMVRYYLANEDERAAIAAAGRRRCANSGYSHADRVAYMLECLFGGRAVSENRPATKA
jgi:hypothetical protein